METSSSYIVFMIIASAGTLLLMVFVIINLFFNYKNRQLKHKNEVLDLNSKFEKELLNIKNELTEQVFTDIAAELHDDICQTLTLGVYQINQSEAFGGPIDKYVSSSRDTIKQGISDLRNISHLLSRDYWKNYDIHTALNKLNDKLNNTNRINTNFSIDPDIEFDSKDQEIIIIRIFQELINNTLKHSQASLIEISLTQESNEIRLVYNDNGIGFKQSKNSSGDGLGMMSITQRMKLLNAVWQIDSENQNGFQFISTIPIKLNDE
jgi:two-component system NarL family sensor kinase